MNFAGGGGAAGWGAVGRGWMGRGEPGWVSTGRDAADMRSGAIDDRFAGLAVACPAPGTLRALIRALGMSVQQFQDML
jgi:hypothetical protein